MKPCWDSRLLTLSNGETRRVLLTRALLKHPAVLLLDAPFSGLDAATREVLKETLDRIAGAGTSIVLVASPEDWSACITHVLALADGKRVGTYDKPTFLHRQPAFPSAKSAGIATHPPLTFPPPEPPSFQTVVRMKNVRVAYGGVSVLDGIDWTVRSGEKWALLGLNGSGKSTLLSLINGDNPQAYANDLWLFDRRHGTGESIWDIKKLIGFVSPELHAYYPANVSCGRIVAAGHFDQMGEAFSAFKRAYSDEQAACTQACFQALGIQSLMAQPFSRVSAGEQRLVLLARALVKNPPLLILDEPCQGLDDTVHVCLRGRFFHQINWLHP